MQTVTEEDNRILQEPKPNITIKELSENSVKFELPVWVNSSDHWKVQVETTEKIKECFDAASIPFAATQTNARSRK